MAKWHQYAHGGGYGLHGFHGFHGGGHGNFHWGHGRPWHPRRWHGLFGGGQTQAPPAPDPQVSMAQSCLAQSVDPSVPQDGMMGPQTLQAIRTFQTQQQLPPTGMLDPNTMSALQAACSGQQGGQQGGQQAAGQSGPPPGQGQTHSHHEYETAPGYDEAEGEFWPGRPFERRFQRDDRFREDRWRRDHDRRPPFLFQEAEEEFRPSRPEPRAPFVFRPRDFRVEGNRLRWDSGRRWYPRPEGGFIGGRWERQHVLWAQSCLARILGTSVVQNGIMGPNMQSALAMFQEQRQLPPTGALDDATVNALRAACAG